MPKLLEQASELMRINHYALKTERSYLHWMRRYILFHDKRHPREMGTPEVTSFLSHLAVRENVSASTQNQALSAVLYLYRNVLGVELSGIAAVRATKETRLPTVLTQAETRSLLDAVPAEYQLVTRVLYVGGLRLMEGLRLRVKDVDLNRLAITVRDTKSNRDRETCLPKSLVDPLRCQIERVKAIHSGDVAHGYGRVEMPYALAKKYPNADHDLAWQFLFPSWKLSADPRTGEIGRHHIYETSVQRAVAIAAKKIGVNKPVGPHTLRHCFATHMLQNGYDIHTIKKLLGHKDIRTTEVYLHLIDGVGVVSPLD